MSKGEIPVVYEDLKRRQICAGQAYPARLKHINPAEPLACMRLLEDAKLVDIAQRERRLEVTKDDAIVQFRQLPARLQKPWLAATGNIGNAALEELVR